MHIAASLPAPHSLASAAPTPRLVSAAHEFEAELMKELLTPLERDPLFSSDSNPDSDSGLGSGSGSSGALADFAAQSLGQAISRSGGLGIATRILQTLAPHSAAHSGVTSPGTSSK